MREALLNPWMAGTFIALAILVVLTAQHLITAAITFRATAWVPALSRRMSSWVTAHHYEQDAFFDADGADAASVDRRKRALDRLSSMLGARHARSAEWGDGVREGFSDLRFADANRVPFPFAPAMRERFDLTTVVTASDGPRLRDLDGGWSLDVSGSYGLNVAGFDRYKEWIQKGWDHRRAEAELPEEEGDAAEDPLTDVITYFPRRQRA